jgi:diketogulonate reductase-like aldo/keto reductase
MAWDKKTWLKAVDVYEIHWRRRGDDSSHLRLFPMLQKEGLREGVSTAPLTATDEAMEGGRQATGFMSR